MRRRTLNSIAAIVLLAGCTSQPPPPRRVETPPAAAPAAGAAASSSGVVEGAVSSADGVPIHYRAEGSGETALVFVHGWSCDGSYWKNQVPFFSRSFRVVTLDLAGHGASGSGRKDWTVEAYADDVDAVVQALGLARVVLIGHSMSGPITMEAARKMPGRVIALIPIDTLQDLAEKPDPKAWEDIAAPIRADFRKGTAELVRRSFPANADPALVEEVAADMSAAPPEVGLGTFDGLWRYDIQPALAELTIPIHCINGDLWPTRVEENRRVYSRYDVAFLPGLGHFPMLESPQAFNEKLLEVVRAVAG